LRIATARAMLRHIARSLQPVDSESTSHRKISPAYGQIVPQFFSDDVRKGGVIVIHINPALLHKSRLCVPAVGEAT